MANSKEEQLNKYIDLASQYKHRTDFRNDYPYPYQVIHDNGWADICFKHMERKKTIIKWTKENAFLKAKEYDYMPDFIKSERRAYLALLNMGELEAACSHMERYNFNTKWPEQALKDDGLRFKTLADWKKNNKYAFSKSFKEDWFEEFALNFSDASLFGVFTKDECILNASKYSNYTRWKICSKPMHEFAVKKGWLEECRAAISRKRKPKI